MKKIMIMVAALFACVSMSAQMKGDKTIYGNLGFGGGSYSYSEGSITGKVSNPDGFNFDIGVGFGYFITDKVEIGLQVGFDHFKKQNNLDEYLEDSSIKKLYNTESTFSLVPSLKYYAPIVEETVYYTPGVSLGFGFNSGKIQAEETITVDDDTQPFVFALGIDLLAFEFKPSYNIGINVSLGGFYFRQESIDYDIEGTHFKTSTTEWAFDIDSIFSPTIGFKYYFF